jgi:Inverse autotransporter, beta-domain
MDSSPCRVALLLLVATILLISTLGGPAGAQGLQQTPYSAADVVRRGTPGGGFDLGPSNPLGLPGSGRGLPRGSDSLYVSDGMLRGILPLIPNLQFGYLYNFGNNRISSGRFTADYLLPFSLSPDSMIFGEAHTEFQDFWKTRSFNSRVDMSFGGGYRTFLGRETLLGVNGFYDTSRLGDTWYSSGGVGFEMAALVGGSDALDLNFNWYGQLFNSNLILNAFRYGPSNFDVQAGYSHELWNGGPDLRLKMAGYKFEIGTGVYGWNTGAELKSRDGRFVLKYDVGHDKVNRTYQTVGGFVNVGFQLENVFKGESPFTVPEPIFRSPRSLRYLLTQTVKRDWHQPAAVIIAQRNTGSAGSLPAGATLPFTRTVFIGVAPTGPGGVHFLNTNITAADLVGVGKVVITWDGGATPTGVVIVELQHILGGGCGSANVDLNGGTSPPGVHTTNPLFWNIACGPWDSLAVFNLSGGPLSFGTMTLSFFP